MAYNHIRAGKSPRVSRRTNNVFQVVEVRRTYNWRGDAFLGQNPGDSKLRHADALLLSYFFEPVKCRRLSSTLGAQYELVQYLFTMSTVPPCWYRLMNLRDVSERQLESVR